MTSTHSKKGSSGKRKSKRHQTREAVIQALYEWQLNPTPASILETSLREQIIDLDKKIDLILFRTFLSGAVAEAETLKNLYAPFLLDRPDNEISPIERAIILLGAFELCKTPETPSPVILNEAIELAKTFGATEGHRFVNGVLDRLAETVRADEVKRPRPQGSSGSNG